MLGKYKLTQSLDPRELQQKNQPYKPQQSRFKSHLSPNKQSAQRQTSLLRRTAQQNNQRSMLNQSHLMFDQAFAEQFFARSINKSYIGQMSGKKQQFHAIKLQEMQEHPNLSQNQSNIINYSRIFYEPLPEIKQVKESVLSFEATHLMKIVTFCKGSYELFKKQQCIPCSNFEYKNQCKIDIINQFSIEIYIRGGSEQFDLLFLTFNFDTIQAQVQFEDIPQNCQLVLKAGEYKLSLQHQLRENVKWWFNKLSKIIQQSKGRKFGLTTLLGVDEFYKKRVATEEYFSSQCQTGDIILFQDDHFFARAQRFFTQSDYDHIGMVIKDLNYGTLIFQANSGSGVCLTPWKYVVKYEWYKFIPKIAWRRLSKTEKGNKFNETIEKFIIENIQKHYHISFAKITANQSIIRHSPIDTQDKAEKLAPEVDDTGFFCSELIATIYKQLGLLTRDISSTNYQPACKFYPKDFSQRGGRKLDEGELSAEYTIYFDDKLIKATQSA